MPGQESSLSFRYAKYLCKRNVAASRHQEYLASVHKFLEVSPYVPGESGASDRIRVFMRKLAASDYTLAQRQSAANAISLYFQMLKDEAPPTGMSQTPPSRHEDESTASQTEIEQRANQSDAPPPVPQGEPVAHRWPCHYLEAGYTVKSGSPEWDRLIDTLAAEIKVRHYSRRTLKTYAHWSRQFQHFLKNKPPEDLSTDDVKEYLTFLATRCRVAASTQNQAFNSLLFLYRHGLKREFGELRGVPRAKKSLYIPTVLSRAEIDSILLQLPILSVSW